VIVWLALAGWVAQDIPSVKVTSEFLSRPGGREILSPALPRNGWSGFHLIVTGPPGAEYQVHIGQNPEDFAQVKLHRDQEQLSLPHESKIAEDGSPGIYRLEFFIPRSAPVRRLKLEPQVYMEPAGWIVYPMEARIVDATVPETPPKARSWRELFCGAGGGEISRYEQQDLRLATQRTPEDVRLRFERAAGVTMDRWCKSPPPADPEWYLPFRDWLLR
jgi:hypothetical protein